MSEPAGPRGVTGHISRIVEGLPASLIVLLVINTCFLGGLFWMLDRQNASRETVITRLLDNCINQHPATGGP